MDRGVEWLTRHMNELAFGIGTFGDVTEGPGGLTSHAQVIRDVVEEAVLADQVGIDAFALGEHHRDDFAVTSPETVLAAAAARTSRILLASGVTVLSSDDPVRVFERFSTLDALSNGRAEVQLGRGSFTESFPLFGLDLRDYEVLFAEKLDLFTRLREGGAVTWEGTVRAALTDQEVYPRLEHGPLRTWVGVGGSPESVVRTARHGLPMMLAIIGGAPARFAPYVDLYRRALAQLELPALPVGVHSPGHVGETDESARAEFFVGYRAMRERIGRERGWSALGQEEFLDEVEHGSLYVGSAETVARKIASTVRSLGIQRFDMKVSAGTLPHAAMMGSIERYGTLVVPRVRELLAEAPAPIPA
jgi:probable LLM family oxidoreductase